MEYLTIPSSGITHIITGENFGGGVARFTCGGYAPWSYGRRGGGGVICEDCKNGRARIDPAMFSQPLTAPTHEQIAERLLTPLWKGIPSDYKAKYARNIWGQFEDNIRGAAYCDRLSRFLDKIAQRLGIAVLEADAAKVTGFLAEADTRATLKALREDTALLVLLVRVANEERRAAFTAKAGNGAAKERGPSAYDSLREYEETEAEEPIGSLFDQEGQQ